MNIKSRTAKALDDTHAIGERGPKTYITRNRLAKALDKGTRIAKKDVEWLESVVRHSNTSPENERKGET